MKDLQEPKTNNYFKLTFKALKLDSGISRVFMDFQCDYKHLLQYKVTYLTLDYALLFCVQYRNIWKFPCDRTVTKKGAGARDFWVSVQISNNHPSANPTILA